MFRLGIDLGGTKIEGAVLDASGNVVFRERVLTEQQHGYEHILDRIKSLYAAMRADINDAPHTLGVGAPGAVSPRGGLLKNANTLCLNRKPLKSDLEQRLGRPIAMQNDANCFALAESLHGAARDRNLVFGVIMGTGCGGGIVYQREIFVGLQGIAGEWGHMTIDPAGPRCYCGQRGCVETYISGGGLEARYAEQHDEKLGFRQIVQRYHDGDAMAVEFIKVFLQYFGRALGNLINVLDPDIIVLGGGVSNFDPLYTDGLEQVRRFVFSDSLETPIVKHQLGDSAGVIGAALLGV